MVLQKIKRYSVAEFEAFVNRPENAERLFEYIAGEIVEVPSNPYSSQVASLIAFFIHLFLRENKLGGHVTGEAGGYKIQDERYAPDVAYIAAGKTNGLPYYQGYSDVPLDLAVEVVSPSDDMRHLNIKIANYLAAGTLVWVAYPTRQEVEVFAPGQTVRIIGNDGTLDGGAVLPGFSLAVREIFPPMQPD